MKAGFALSVWLLTSGSWATAPNPARAAPLGEVDREVGAGVDHLYHRAPPAADLSDAANRVLGHPKITVVPEAFVRETPPAGAFERFLGNDKALAVIDFGVQTVGAPPGTVQAMASLVLWLMDELDATLHPEMVKHWLAAVVGGLVAEQGIKCILTTHSPTTVALAPESALYEITGGQLELKSYPSKPR